MILGLKYACIFPGVGNAGAGSAMAMALIVREAFVLKMMKFVLLMMNSVLK